VVAQVVPSKQAVTVALTCSEPCTLVGVSGGTPIERRTRLVSGRPALVTVVTSPADEPLLLTIADAAGNRTIAQVAR
jgi:hypothetical protein